MSLGYPKRMHFVALLASSLLVQPASVLQASFSRASVSQASSQERERELQTLLVHAAQALQRGQLEVAERQFESARELDPTHPYSWIGLSQVAAGRGEIITALELAREAADRAPDHPGVALLEGRLLARLRRVDSALEALERARALGPEVSDPWVLAALLLRDAGRPDEAVELLEEAISSGVTDPAAVEQLGLLLLDTERFEQAADLASNHLEHQPDNGSLVAIHGIALARLGERQEDAAPQLLRALELGSAHRGQIRLELGALWIEAGRLQEAGEQLELAARDLPHSAEVHYRLATVRRLLGNGEGARAALERFQELQAEDDREDWADKELGTALNEAQRLASENRLESALAGVDRILAAAPDEDRAHGLRAKVLFSLGRREEALEALARAKTLMPSRVEYHYLEGTFLHALARPDEAEAALRRALALDPDLDEAHTLLRRLAAERDRRPGDAGSPPPPE